MSFRHVNTETLATASILTVIPTGIQRQTPITVYNGHTAPIFVGDSTINTSADTIGRTIPASTSQHILRMWWG